jgi:hypothetical protein
MPNNAQSERCVDSLSRLHRKTGLEAEIMGKNKFWGVLSGGSQSATARRWGTLAANINTPAATNY